MNAEKFKEAIYEGVSTGNWSLLEEWILEESSFSYNYKPFPEENAFDEEVYKQIVDLLNNIDFLTSSGSSNILRLLEYDWGILTEDQKSQLLPILRAAFPKTRYGMTWFLISEILGEYYANTESLEVLLCLASVDIDEARSLIVMGLEKLVRTPTISTISQKAFAKIESMVTDPSECVRNKAKSSIQRINSQKC